jgi:hypothetical protein
MKKVFLLPLLLWLPLSAFGQAALGYSVQDDSVSITDYFGQDPHVVIPAVMDRRPVASIATGAFIDKKLVSVVLPDSVREIGAAAFAENPLLTIVLGSGVNVAASAMEAPFIEYYRQRRQAGGVYCRYDGGWHYLGAFTSGFVPVVLGGHVTIVKYVGTGRNVRIPGQLHSFPVAVIGKSAFEDCRLRAVTIPGGVYRIEEDAFRQNYLSRLDLPDSVVEIQRRAFSRNYLARLRLPPRITALEEEVFFDNLLTQVDIPSEVRSIGNGAFSVNLIERLTFSGDKLLSIQANAFSVNQISRVELPPLLTEIGDRAFFNNRLAEVEIPGQVASLGDEAFSVNRLAAVRLPQSLRKIGRGAFSGNPGLVRVTVAGAGASIDESVFGHDFARYYDSLRLPGSYVLSGGAWSLVPGSTVILRE